MTPTPRPSRRSPTRSAWHPRVRQPAGRLRGVPGAADGVARKGGDEFRVLIAGLEPNSREDGGDNLGDALQITQAIAGQIHHALRAPFDLDGSELFVGA